MADFTPGPWQAGTGYSDTIFGQRREDGGFNPIGYVYCPAFPERSEVGQTALANARLISAAPDLLEALKLVIEHYGEDSDVFYRARAAILKATSSSSAAEVKS